MDYQDWLNIIKIFFSKNSFAKKSSFDINSFNHKISIKQSLTLNKLKDVETLKKASDEINNVIIKPKQVFSFWRVLMKINEIRDLPEQASILSGIIYLLSLKSNLEIIERHNHSFEDNNFILGTDAEVIYKSKDLKIKNNYSFPIVFKISITSEQIMCSLLSTKEIKVNLVEFKIISYKNRKDIFTRINKKTVTISSYKII